MMYKEKVADCSEIRTKHSTQSEHHVEIWTLNLVVRKETARLEMVSFKLQNANTDLMEITTSF
jgi:hypothetical protein